VPVTYLAARMLFSRRAGLIAGAVAAFSPALVWYSQEARPYALAFLLSVLSFLFFARVLLAAPGSRLSGPEREPPTAGFRRIEDDVRRSCVLWAMTSVLATATHYFTWFLVLVEAVWLLVVTRERPGEPGVRNAVRGLARPVVLASLALAAMAVCLASLAIYQRVARGGSDLGVIAHVSLTTRLRTAIDTALFGDATGRIHVLLHLNLYVVQHPLVWVVFVVAVALAAAGYGAAAECREAVFSNGGRFGVSAHRGRPCRS
jgi:uncharacterized membrane protein